MRELGEFDTGSKCAQLPIRDQLKENVLTKLYYLDVDIAHLISFNEELAHRLTTEPADIIPLVCPQFSEYDAALDS